MSALAFAIRVVCMAAVAAILGTPGIARATDTGNGFQGGVLAGIGPTEPLSTQLMVGAWVGAPLGKRWQVELSGTYRDGFDRHTDLYRFLKSEQLLDTKNAIADRTLWTGDVALRFVPLRGKLALLQSSLGAFALHTGVGAGVRATESLDGVRAATLPAGLLAAGIDFLPGNVLIVRLDTRLVGHQRFDDSVGVLAEVLLGIGGRL